MAYIGSSPTKVVSRQSANIFTYTATANQTAFTGSDANGNTLACTPSDIMVHMNGLRLEESDYTATTTTVTLGSGAAAGDEVTITAFVTFETADAYTKSASDTRYVNTSGDTMTGALTVDAAAATVLTVDRATSDGTIIDLQKDGTSVGKLGIQTSGFYIDGESGHEGIRFGNGSVNPRENGADSDGTGSLGTSSARWSNLYLSGGAYIGGTGDANKLDDYEEGSWTPTINAHTGTVPTVSYGTQLGDYVKIGNIVMLTFEISISSISGNAGQYISIQGQPFDFKGSSPRGAGAFTSNVTNWARTDIIALSRLSNTSMGFLSQNNNTNWGWEALSAWAASDTIRGSIYYEVS
ncbi:hypothetical protein N8630_03020 [Synechococcus sp. AH-601-C19]|nr:hypothetical protein [Synechococcus sp. AH-601-C19]